MMMQSLEKSKNDNPTANCSIFGKKRRFPIGSGQDKYLAKHNAFFDQLDLVTYEEVCMLVCFVTLSYLQVYLHIKTNYSYKLNMKSKTPLHWSYEPSTSF